MKTETGKLYYRVFWIFLPNVVKIDPYNFEIYCFKVGAFFSETPCILELDSRPTRIRTVYLPHSVGPQK